MAKYNKNQIFVLKIHTDYLKKHNWCLQLNLNEIRNKAQLVVSLGSSQVLRWLDKIDNRCQNETEVTLIKQEIKKIKKEESSPENKKRISTLYDKLYQYQFQQNYVMVVMDTKKDYKYICKHGFEVVINYGHYQKKVKYKRFLGTAGSIKKNTIIFVNEQVYNELFVKINNNRYQGPMGTDDVKKYNNVELNYKFIPAKINAYFALQCSSSLVVPWPRIIVVNDIFTKFNDTVRLVANNGAKENPLWPSVSDPQTVEIENNISDGMGLISPEMSKIWAECLGEGDEPLSGFNTRCAFLKGMVFTVPFVDFAKDVAHSYIVTDAWGDKRDVRDADVIITTSMLKLWDSYAGYEDYFLSCKKNDYDFCVAKTTPRELRNVHTTNYQYLQDFNLNDDDVSELVSPTINSIKSCIGEDWEQLILYTCGENLNEDNVRFVDDVYKAIMIEPSLVNDEYIRKKIIKMIQKRINQAKIGVLDVEGDYAIIGNDIYGFMQGIFGLPVVGALKRGECYHKYWTDKNVDEILAFRAPMTSHENVCKLKVVTNNITDKWFRYIKTCCILNSWDTTPIRCNGADYDSDTFFTTNNPVLLKQFEYKPTLMCLQEKTTKIIPQEEDYIESDINGFGDSIGSVTNKATNMISLISNFSKDSEEYKRLSYRISTMMNYQQNAIDRIKGVVAKPVPKEWLDPFLFKIRDEDDEDVVKDKNINAKIAANIKPWFFIYRYTSLRVQLNKYLTINEQNCKIRFGCTISDLYKKDNLSIEERQFLTYYEKYMPVSRAPGTMNKICWFVENQMLDFQAKKKNVNFDYSLLKTGRQYSQVEYLQLKKLYLEYNSYLQTMLKGINKNDANKEDRTEFIRNLNEQFRIESYKLCSNTEDLANMLLDICYGSEKSKNFVWEIVGHQIVVNLLKKNNMVINIPIKETGNITFNGHFFNVKQVKVDNYDNFR